jgi:hypothetical protein
LRDISAAVKANGLAWLRPDEEKAFGVISERTERRLPYRSCCLAPASYSKHFDLLVLSGVIFRPPRYHHLKSMLRLKS